MLSKSMPQGDVVVSHSADGSLQNVKELTFPFESIVSHDNVEQYINIPSHDESLVASSFDAFNATLKEIGLQVSTGAVVDFRAKDSLCAEPRNDTAPLLYPVHFKNNRVCWPVESKKPNALRLSKKTEKMVLPSGYYVTVKRFSSKEEKQRIVASLVTASDFTTSCIAFENHLDVFLHDKHGLDQKVAYGLVVWLNTSWLDEKFRLFSGHTQVNATDLRNLPYPSIDQLRRMGERLENENVAWSQELFDLIAKEVANGK